MDSNTHSTSHSTGTPAGLAALAAELQGLADQGAAGLADGALAERVMALRGLMDRLEGQWLADLAAWTPAAPPAPNRACRPARPLPGYGPGSV